ncbi:MAG: ATP-binding cassette domain-containing protein [Fusobacteriaceae bacterium]|nr:ATP-binding cassette domain-containing protein [Fusobacteriaceae bacterium]
MIKINNLNITLNYKVLYINNFVFKKGMSYVILGPSGIGKTTFLNTVASLFFNYSGNISNTFNRISYAFQENRLIPWLSVIDNFKYVCSSYVDFDKLLKIFKIKNLENILIKNLSGGEKQRVSMARAFLNNPELILMDENLSSLDLKLKISIIDEMNIHLSQNDQTLIYVSHNIDEALLIADTVVIFNEKGELDFSLDICMDKSQRKNQIEELACFEKIIIKEMMK